MNEKFFSRVQLETKSASQEFHLLKALILAATANVNPVYDFDGFEMAINLKGLYGIIVDHHDCVSVMDAMTRTGQAVCTQGYGRTRYRITG